MAATRTTPPTPTAPTGAPASALSSSAAILRTEFRLFCREAGALFWILAFPTLLLVVLGFIPEFRQPNEEMGGTRVIDLYVPVAVLLATITAGIQSMPTVLTGYRERGVLRRLRVTPARPASLLVAQLLLHGAAVLVSGAVALTVGRLVYDVPLPQQPFGYAVAFVLATFASLAIGTLISAFSKTTKISSVIGTVVFFPMMFTSGVWLPVQAMPDVVRNIVEWTPLGAASQALDAAAGGSWPAWLDLLVTAVWGVVVVAGAARWFRWE